MMRSVFSVSKLKGKPKKSPSELENPKTATPDDYGRDNVISPLPSCSSIATSPLPSDAIEEEQVLSSENSMMSDDNSGTAAEPTKNAWFKVHIRIKPLEEQDIGTAPSSRLRCVQVKGEQNLVLCTRPSLKTENTGSCHWFKFNHVLDETSSQKDVYDVTTQPLVEMALKGYHTCLIAYGSPGSGKSHALFGKASSGRHKGLIIRAAEALKAVHKNDSKEMKTEVSMSFVQIYNEKIYDILDPSATDNIKFHDVGDVHSLEGVTEWPVETTEDVTKQLRRNPNRLRDAGRSHTIFSLLFRKEEEFEVKDEDATKSFQTTVGRIDFVDLVGVTRSTKHSTHESIGNNATAKANRSLQVFSNVLWALTDTKNNPPPTPPYKDSRLTRFLREALGGNCVTSLLVTASSCPNSAHETLNCLAFAKRAMAMKNFPAPYVSIEKIAVKDSVETPEDDNAGSIPRKDEETNSSGKDSAVAKHNEEVMDVSQASETTQDNPSGTLPPIHTKPSSTSGAHHGGKVDSKFSGVSKENSKLQVKSDTQSESQRSMQKSNKKSNSSRDKYDGEGPDRRRNRDKSKKLKRRSHVTKGQDSNCLHETSVDQESSHAKAGLTLPRIGTPDLGRHPGSASTLPSSSESKARGKGQSLKQAISDSITSHDSDALMRVNKRPQSSHKSAKQQEELSYKSAEDPVKTSDEIQAFSELRSTSNNLFSASTASLDCCRTCRERENKIKRDYDRMILFSKKDRDVKQSRIEELEVLLVKARNQSAPLAEVQRLSEEKVKDHQALKKQKELVETYRHQLATMVSSTEWGTLQEMRRNDVTEIEKLKQEISTLKTNLEEQIDGATKMLTKKSEQIAEFEAEIAILRSKVSKTDAVNKSEYDELKARHEQFEAEREQEISKHQLELKEITFKLTCASAQISQLQESRVETEKLFQEEKESMNRNITVLSKQVAELSKSKKKQEVLQKISLTCDSSTNTEDIRSKLNGLSYSVHCLKCAAEQTIDEVGTEEVPTLQDAELRILLIQDTKNRELLLQLKRERNLLRDVMKIMYCRQWFTEEGNPHVKRTLRKVGIDTRELVMIKK